ncbi:MAG: DUF86 domain-containing protein [Nitrospirae bacterium]|nr:DUF86 domain-containing protein [Nitrospirota bacterium]MBF0535349.1 DUF86 domain-containing protein [Nitrospirota bacterium]MBF0616869.1 DUF86 domain-containing protein [Nitrospirota bacterium]
MFRDGSLYLEDILGAIERIRKYLRGMDYDSFIKDRKTQDAVVRNLEIIGEAAAQLPELYLQAAPEIQWRKIVGIRNILIHEYFGVSLPIIWDIVQTKLDILETTCRSLLNNTML